MISQTHDHRHDFRLLEARRELHWHLAKARQNVRDAQHRLRCWPKTIIKINDVFWFSMAWKQIYPPPDYGSELRCFLDDDLLKRILRREAHWNSAELAGLIRFHRIGPYNPDVHTLLCFLHE